MMSRMEVSSPPGVFMRSSTTTVSAASACSMPRMTKSLDAGPMAPSSSSTIARRGAASSSVDWATARPTKPARTNAPPAPNRNLDRQFIFDYLVDILGQSANTCLI